MLPASAHPRLTALVGKPKCATANLLGLTTLSGGDDYAISAIRSQQAACLLIGRLSSNCYRAESGNVAVPPRYRTSPQYDTLLGPAWANLEGRVPSPGCYCKGAAG